MRGDESEMIVGGEREKYLSLPFQIHDAKVDNRPEILMRLQDFHETSELVLFRAELHDLVRWGKVT